MIFETHAHYDDKAFKDDLKEMLDKIKNSDVAYVVDVASTLKSIDKILKLTKEYPFIYGTVGIQPTDTKDLDDKKFKKIENASKNEKIVAIGEIGLDYYWDKEKEVRNTQKKWFEAQIELARRSSLPLVIHSRDAAKDTLDIMKSLNTGDIGGVIHCFSYEKEMAREYLNMGFYLGIGGVVTFKNSRKLKEVVEYSPIENLVLETDAPYLTPTPHRGERNDSTYLKYVIEEIARIKNMSPQEVEDITFNNAMKMYNISN